MINPLAVSTWSLHRHLARPNYTPAAYRIDVTEFPAMVRDRFGVTNVEICQMHLESAKYSYLEKVRKALVAADVSILNMPIDVGNIAQADTAARMRDIELLKDWIRAAAYLGSPAVRINTGRSDTPFPDLPTIIESYRILTNYGKQLNVRVLIENHGGISSDPTNIMKILRGVNSFYYFRALPDFGNWEPEVRYDGIRIMLPFAYIVHAKTLDFNDQGEMTAFNFGIAMRLVKAADFRGPLSVEFEGEGDQYDGIARSLELIKHELAEPAPALG